MSRTLTIKETCERSLRAIGALSINDVAAQPRELQEAQYWLDLIIGHAAATLKALWLVPSTISCNLPTGVNTLDLATLFGSAAPLLGAQFIVDGYVRNFVSANTWAPATVYPPGATVQPIIPNGFFYSTVAGGTSGAVNPLWPISITGTVQDNTVLWVEAGTTTGVDEPVDILSRGEYDEIPNKVQTGRPQAIYVDRLVKPSVTWWPMVDPNAGVTYQLKLTIQTFAPDVTGNAAGAHFLRNAWQLWAVMALAARLGSGPVRMLDDTEQKIKQGEADRLWLELVGNENQEIARPRHTNFSDLG